MATIIDELILTFGLDPSDFTKGQKEAAKNLLDLKDKTKSTGDSMIKSLRGVAAEFVALFLTVKGVADVVHWLVDLNSTIAELGYTSANLGQSAGELRTWQQVAEQMGGTAEGVARTLDSLQNSLFAKQFHGQVSEQLIDLMRLGVQLKTNAQGVVDLHQLMSDLANRVKSMPRVQANQLLMEAGIDEGLRNVIFAGPQAVERWYKREQATAKQTAASTQASQQLQQAWNDLRFSMTGIGAQIIRAIEPALQEVFHSISGWFGKHQGDITHGIQELFAWAQGDGPKNVMNALSGIADAAVKVAKAVNALFPSDSGALEQATAPNASQGVTDTVLGSTSRAFARERIADVAHQYGIPVAALSNLPPGTDIEKAAKAIAANFTKSGGQLIQQPGFLGRTVGIGQDLGYQYGLSAGKLPADWQAAVDAYLQSGNVFAPNANALKRANSPVATPGASARIGSAPRAAISAPASKTTSVSIGDVTINTQATDAQGIAGDFADATRQKLDVALADTGQN